MPKILMMLNMCLVYDFLFYFYLKYKLFTIEVEKKSCVFKTKIFYFVEIYNQYKYQRNNTRNNPR